jgi:integrase
MRARNKNGLKLGEKEREAMNGRECELRDALIAPINRALQKWKRAKPVIPAPLSQPAPEVAPPRARAIVLGKARAKEKLPRGIRRRERSLEVYLTFPDGHAERRSLGNVSVKMATQQREIWQREIAEGRYVKKVPRPKKVLFRELADLVLEHSKNFKRAWDADAGRIAKMKEWWGNRLAASITAEQINEQLLANVSPRGARWSEATSNHFRILLLQIFELAIKRGELVSNPAREVHRYKLSNERHRELGREEENRLRGVIRENYPEKEVELDLALHTGVRHSNLYGIHTKGRKPMPPLQWKDVDFDWRLLRLPRAKSGSGYCVPLNDVAFEALRKLRERSDGTGPAIRTESGREIHSCRKWFENSLAKAAIDDFRWHDLRHTFATRLRRNGVPIEDIALLLNHKIPGFEMTIRYAHGDLERLHKAVATLVKSDTKTDTSAIVAFPRAARV